MPQQRDSQDSYEAAYKSLSEDGEWQDNSEPSQKHEARKGPVSWRDLPIPPHPHQEEEGQPPQQTEHAYRRHTRNSMNLPTSQELQRSFVESQHPRRESLRYPTTENLGKKGPSASANRAASGPRYPHVSSADRDTDEQRHSYGPFIDRDTDEQCYPYTDEPCSSVSGRNITDEARPSSLSSRERDTGELYGRASEREREATLYSSMLAADRDTDEGLYSHQMQAGEQAPWHEPAERAKKGASISSSSGLRQKKRASNRRNRQRRPGKGSQSNISRSPLSLARQHLQRRPGKGSQNNISRPLAFSFQKEQEDLHTGPLSQDLPIQIERQTEELVLPARSLSFEPFLDVMAAESDLWDIIEIYPAAVRVEAVDALCMLSDARTLLTLVCALRDRHWEVRAAAAQALGNFRDPKIVEALREAISYEEDGIAKQAMIRTLGKQRDPYTISTLNFLLRKDSDCLVREAAAWALGQWQEKAPVQSLIRAFQRDTDELVRASAAQALGMTGSAGAKAAGPVLQAALETECDSDVCEAIAEALQKLSAFPDESR